MNILNLIPYGKPIAAALLGLAIAFASTWLYSKGYSSAEAKWSVKYNNRENELIRKAMDEQSRQRAANEAAKKVEAERIAMIRAENQALEERIKELEHEADNDPDADRIGVSDGSRMRIDSVR